MKKIRMRDKIICKTKGQYLEDIRIIYESTL